MIVGFESTEKIWDGIFRKEITMRQKIKVCILYYVDDDEKTYNPGLILTDSDVEDEICKETMELREQGRNVRIFTAHLADDISHLPSMIGY